MVPPVCAECLRKQEDAGPLSPGTCCNARASEGRGGCRQGRRHPSRQPPCWRRSGPARASSWLPGWKPVFLSVQPRPSRPSPHWPTAAPLGKHSWRAARSNVSPRVPFTGAFPVGLRKGSQGSQGSGPGGRRLGSLCTPRPASPLLPGGRQPSLGVLGQRPHRHSTSVRCE